MLKTGENESIHAYFRKYRFLETMCGSLLLFPGVAAGYLVRGESLPSRGRNAVNGREFDTLIIIHLLLTRATMRR